MHLSQVKFAVWGHLHVKAILGHVILYGIFFFTKHNYVSFPTKISINMGLLQAELKLEK